MSLDLKTAAERTGRPASPDDLVLWGAQLWATPEPELSVLAAGFREVIADDDRHESEREAARRLLAAVECALIGNVPSVEVMRAAGLAIAAIPRGEL